MISSAAAEIEAKAGENWTIVTKAGKILPDYAKVQGVLIGAVIVWTLIFVSLGPDAHGSHFEAAKTAAQAGAGRQDAAQLTDGAYKRSDVEDPPVEEEAWEKAQVEHAETAKR